MNVKWLIEDFDADNKIWETVAEVRRLGLPCEIADYYNFYLNGNVVEDGKKVLSKFQDDDCVIFQGSIQLALWIKRNKPWVPGMWFEPEKFKCTYFYSYLGEFLFNQDYIFSTIGEYKRRRDMFYHLVGKDDCLFMRPDNGTKSFTGQIFKKETHNTDWAFFDTYTKAEDIVVIAPPKRIHAEYRFVIGGDEIVGASMYRYEDKARLMPGAPKRAHNVVKEIVKVINKDMKIGAMYVVDIAEDYDDKYSLMEINCFNCAGLYETDRKAVVAAANQLAWNEYQEYMKVEEEFSQS